MRKPVLNSPTDRLTHEQIRRILTPFPGGRKDLEFVCPVCHVGHLFLFGEDDFDCKNKDGGCDETAVARKLYELIGSGNKHVPKVMPKPSASSFEEPSGSLSRADYGLPKYLDTAILDRFNVTEGPHPYYQKVTNAVCIPYYEETGKLVTQQWRWGMGSKNRRFLKASYASKVFGSDGGSYLYGRLQFINAMAAGEGLDVLFICEGESNVHTLEQAGFPAFGLPGVGNWQTEWANLPACQSAERIFFLYDMRDGEPEPQALAGAAKVAKSFGDKADKIYGVRLPTKDVSDLWVFHQSGWPGEGERGFRKDFSSAVLDAKPVLPKLSADLDLVWPEPMREVAFYGLAGQVVQRLSPEVESDSVALLANFLSMAGVLFGREAWAQVGATRHYPFEFVTLVGATSRARKGTGTNLVLSVVERVEEGFEKERVLSGLSTGEGLIKAVQDKDEAIRNRGFLVKLGEFASLLEVMKRESNTMSAALRQAWDGERLRVLTRKEPLDADNVSLSVIAHITQSELLNKLTSTDRVNGFANRFLMLCTRRDKLLPRGGGIPNTSDLVVAIHDAVEAAKGRGAIARSNEAEELWSQEYARLTSGGDSLKDALCARAEAHVLRLSLLYALLDSSAEIRPEHLRAAIAFWDYCERSVGHIFGGTTGDADGDKLLAALSSGPMTRSDITRLYSGHRTAEWLDAKLADMVRTGRVRQTKLSKSGKEYEAFEKA